MVDVMRGAATTYFQLFSKKKKILPATALQDGVFVFFLPTSLKTNLGLSFSIKASGRGGPI
jgi:hypothetical protein